MVHGAWQDTTCALCAVVFTLFMAGAWMQVFSFPMLKADINNTVLVDGVPLHQETDSPLRQAHLTTTPGSATGTNP